VALAAEADMASSKSTREVTAVNGEKREPQKAVAKPQESASTRNKTSNENNNKTNNNDDKVVSAKETEQSSNKTSTNEDVPAHKLLTQQMLEYILSFLSESHLAAMSMTCKY
jgi:hypothetical protein